jgi:predicted aspartyl protease
MKITNKNYMAFLTAAIFCTAQASAESACHYREQADLAFSHAEPGTTPSVAGAINGQPVKFLLDTGASQTYVLKQEADRQHLNPERIKKQAQGIGGLSSIFLVKIKDFAIGDAHATNLRFPVIETMGTNGTGGIIGADFLMQYDVELNFADNRVKLFRADHCEERDLAYWDKNAMSIPMELTSGSKHARIQVKINGVPLWALIDSGASRTFIDRDIARKLGFSAEKPGVKYSGKVAGIGPQKRESWTMTFESFAIGDEVVQHPRIAVIADDDEFIGRKQYGVVLGRDFLSAHHVLIATSQLQFYYTYNGGEVFPVSEEHLAKAAPAAP